MAELKKISKDAIPGALAKIERYRFLNQPVDAESISRDILAIDPGNQEAHVALLLSLSDQFVGDLDGFDEALKLVQELDDEYTRLYFTGIIYERRARAHWRKGTHGSGYVTYEWFKRALAVLEEAQALRPTGNDESVFRWNAIVRTMKRYAAIQPQPEAVEQQLE